jgi:hypothetical protein
MRETKLTCSQSIGRAVDVFRVRMSRGSLAVVFLSWQSAVRLQATTQRIFLFYSNQKCRSVCIKMKKWVFDALTVSCAGGRHSRALAQQFALAHARRTITRGFCSWAGLMRIQRVFRHRSQMLLAKRRAALMHGVVGEWRISMQLAREDTLQERAKSELNAQVPASNLMHVDLVIDCSLQVARSRRRIIR